jgi:hypothetical protein
VFAPVAVSVWELPEQNVGWLAVAVTVGLTFTVIEVTAVEDPQEVYPVTV